MCFRCFCERKSQKEQEGNCVRQSIIIRRDRMGRSVARIYQGGIVMTPTWWKRRAKPFVVMAVGVAALSAVEARAMQVNPGDLVLAMFSNGTEYYRNLGQASTLLTGSPVTIDIGSSSLNPFTV